MSKQGKRAAPAAKLRVRLGLSSRVGGESWNYVNHTTTIFAVVSTVLTGCVMGYLLGVLIGIGWTIVATVMLLAMIGNTTRLSAGDEDAATAAIFCNLILISIWTVGAVAMFNTRDPAGMVAATSMGWTWVSHLLIGGQRNRYVMLVGMTMPTVALLYFQIASGWTSYPFWIAITATVSALITALTLGKSAEIAHANVERVGAATAEAKATRSKLEFAIASAGDGYFEIDLDTMVMTPNPKFVQALGFEPGVRSANHLRAFVHAEDAAAATANLGMCRDGVTDAWNQDLRMRAASGESRWMNLRARVLEASDGRPRLLLGTLVDLTARKQMESEILAAKEAAVASSKAKGEFLANMSHEIRTPLNGVLGMAQALQTANLDPADKEKVDVILDSGRSLMALLNDVLDLSKIEAGKLEIAPVAGDFVQAMSRTRQLFQVQAEEKGLELAMTVDTDFPKQLCFDPVRVRQCMSNLVSNAVKFTPSGRVDIIISASAADGDHMVEVKVSDTGIGMSQEAMGNLFGLFSQADSSTTRRFGGSGLGLFISRQLARLMGGDITVASQEGKGSTFTLTFRAKAATMAQPAETGAASAMPRRSLRGVRVLLTDDNAINRQVIKLFLAPHGCEITEAANGKEALDRLAAQPFDVVLLDVHMPVMDGKEAIKLIRSSSEVWSTMPVIALTADAMSGDRERYLALGMTGYVPKPVDQRELLVKLHVALGLAEDAAPQARTNG